jgi:acyl transferase domain-containing protein
LKAGAYGGSEQPLSRWDVTEIYDPDPDAPAKSTTKHGSFIQGWEYFATRYYGIANAEAANMDPMQRVMLEVGYQSFVAASYNKKHLVATATGVSIGCGGASLEATSAEASPFSGTGAAAAIAANRLSFVLGQTGPSMIVDTACSSSLVAAELSLSYLRLSRCTKALAAGVNALCNARTFLAFSVARMLAVEGRCKTFDSNANGYERGEGCGAAVIAPPPTPAPGLGNFAGSGVNQDGRSASLTAPNGPSQQEVIRTACRDAGVRPAHVSVSECHGTGTALGDPIEVGALLHVRASAQSDQPVFLAAAKTNVGHLEIAAGKLGFIKCVQLVSGSGLPPNLHLARCNPHLGLDSFASVMPSETTCQVTMQLAGVSSFGFGGANTHSLIYSPCRLHAPQNCALAPAVYNLLFFDWQHV